jgi:hypothetical protein
MPKKMMTTPANFVRIDIFDEINVPIQVAVAPSKINTMENPVIKKIELYRIIRFSLLKKGVLTFFSLISANETPDIKEIYPGTRGKTHGDKKEIKPAANAI